jgi:hypothetical protein
VDDPEHKSDADSWTLSENEVTDQRKGHRQSREADVNLRIGDSYSVDLGRWVFLYRRYERIAGWYHEWLIDPSTGEPIHHRYEPLPNHTGHGSDKRR